MRERAQVDLVRRRIRLRLYRVGSLLVLARLEQLLRCRVLRGNGDGDEERGDRGRGRGERGLGAAATLLEPDAEGAERAARAIVR